MTPFPWILMVLLLAGFGNPSAADAASSRHASSPLMLDGPWVPANPHEIIFDDLPRVPSTHAIVSDVRSAGGHRVNQHNYLAHYAGRFWAMWSDGPGASRGFGKVPGHDRAGQHVSFATSADGLSWGPIPNLTGPPDAGYGWIARGFWVREGRLLALTAVIWRRAPGEMGCRCIHSSSFPAR